MIDLAEYAMDRAEDAVGFVDDSDGHFGGIASALQDLRHDACTLARPDPVALARRLYARERQSGSLETFYGAAAQYADVFGDAGLAEYRRLAQSEWDAVAPLAPGDDRTFDHDRFGLTHIMETLARLTGDVDAIIAVLARDQASAHQFLRIAEV